MNPLGILLIFAASAFTLFIFIWELSYLADQEDEYEFMRPVMAKAIKEDDNQKMPL